MARLKVSVCKDLVVLSAENTTLNSLLSCEEELKREAMLGLYRGYRDVQYELPLSI
jgi:hypothetical protein